MTEPVKMLAIKKAGEIPDGELIGETLSRISISTHGGPG
jgi:hypothetical protein